MHGIENCCFGFRGRIPSQNATLIEIVRNYKASYTVLFSEPENGEYWQQNGSKQSVHECCALLKANMLLFTEEQTKYWL